MDIDNLFVENQTNSCLFPALIVAPKFKQNTKKQYSDEIKAWRLNYMKMIYDRITNNSNNADVYVNINLNFNVRKHDLSDRIFWLGQIFENIHLSSKLTFVSVKHNFKFHVTSCLKFKEDELLPFNKDTFLHNHLCIDCCLYAQSFKFAITNDDKGLCKIKNHYDNVHLYVSNFAPSKEDCKRFKQDYNLILRSYGNVKMKRNAEKIYFEILMSKTRSKFFKLSNCFFAVSNLRNFPIRNSREQTNILTTLLETINQSPIMDMIEPHSDMMMSQLTNLEDAYLDQMETIGNEQQTSEPTIEGMYSDVCM